MKTIFRLALKLGFGGSGMTQDSGDIPATAILTESGTGLLTESGNYILKE